MKEHQRKSMAYVKSINVGWKSKIYEDNYEKIFKKGVEEKKLSIIKKS